MVATPDGEVPIADLVPGAQPNSTTEVDFKVIGRDGTPVRVSAFHHSGEHPVLTVSAGGRSVTGTANHPLLVIGRVQNVPTLMWKLLGEITVSDVLVVRSPEFSSQSWAKALPLLPDLSAAYRTGQARHLPDDGGDPRQFTPGSGQLGDAGRRPGGLLAAGGLGRPRVRDQRLRLPQHRGPAVAAGHGDAA